MAEKFDKIHYTTPGVFGNLNNPFWRIYIELSDRGTGKSTAYQNFLARKAIKEDKKIIWLKRTETQAINLLRNVNGLLDRRVQNKFKIRIKTQSNKVYFNDVEVGKVCCLSTYGKDKGVAIAFRKAVKQAAEAQTAEDKEEHELRAHLLDRSAAEGELVDVDYIFFDEFSPERDERRTFDAVYCLKQQLETIARINVNIKLFMLSNFPKRAADILDICFNFTAYKFGTYKLHKKRAIIHYFPVSEELKKKKKESLAEIVVAGTPYDADFDSVAYDKDFKFKIIPEGKLQKKRPFGKLYFDEFNAFEVWNTNLGLFVRLPRPNTSLKNNYVMDKRFASKTTPYLEEVREVICNYYKMGDFVFGSLAVQKQFSQCMREIIGKR